MGLLLLQSCIHPSLGLQEVTSGCFILIDSQSQTTFTGHIAYTLVVMATPK